MFDIAVIMALLVGIGSLLTNVGFPKKFMPIINLVLGLVAGITLMADYSIQEQIVNGLALGLGASGLYDLSKPITKTFSEKKEAEKN